MIYFHHLCQIILKHIILIAQKTNCGFGIQAKFGLKLEKLICYRKGSDPKGQASFKTLDLVEVLIQKLRTITSWTKIVK
jgi:hypothetical protein